ncbi:MAG: type II secretion system F family protein [Actinomycetota bacterium]|nr:type II secretion system F family protein [Actinomycetota bacterium]
MIEGFRTELAISAGVAVGVGLLLLVLAVTGIPVRGAVTPGRGPNVKRSTVRILAGVGVGLVVLVLTGWPVLGLVLGLLTALWAKIFGGSAQERRAITRLDGLASWTESLRDTIAGAVGLEQAIPATAVNAAPSIRPALNLLVDRLRVREPLPSALLKFSDDLDDSAADLIVAALILNARLRGPGLREVLTALSESAREELDLRRRVEGSRRSTRRSVQIVVGVTLAFAGILIVFNGTYVAPYGTFEGQIALTIVVVLFATGILWLRRLAGVSTTERFLIDGRPGRGAPVAADKVALP